MSVEFDDVLSVLHKELSKDIRSQKKIVLRDFETYYFETSPKLSNDQIRGLLVGKKDTSKRSGLLYAAGEESWKSKHFKTSAFMALDILARLLDSEENPLAENFIQAFKQLDARDLKAMELDQHLKDAAGNREAAVSIVRVLLKNNIDLSFYELNIEELDSQKNMAIFKHGKMKKLFEKKTGDEQKGFLGIVQMLSELFAKRKTPEELKHLGILKAGNVFGKSVGDLMRSGLLNPATNIPIFLSESFAAIEAQNGLQEEGIFRVSGVKDVVKELQTKIDYDDSVDYSKYDAHTIAGAIKLWLRNMPSPLFPYATYDAFISVAASGSWEKLPDIVQALPTPNKEIIACLCSFFCKVVAQSEYNKMSTQALAIVITPNVLRPEVEDFQSVARDTPRVVAAFTHLIDGYEDIVDEKQADDQSSQCTWTRLKDAATGKYYYSNYVTGETSWDKPDVDYDILDGDDDNWAQNRPERVSTTNRPKRIHQRSNSANILPTMEEEKMERTGVKVGVWEQYNGPQGLTYYNPFTEEVRTERPQEMLPVKEEEKTSNEVMTCKEFTSSWAKNSDGGSYPETTWFISPQYLVTLSGATELTITISSEGKGGVNIGFHVITVPADFKEGTLLNTINSASDILYQGPFDSSSSGEVTLAVSDSRVMIIPCSVTPKHRAEFTLKITSDTAVAIKDLSTLKWMRRAVEGTWTDTSAGGCYPNFYTWRLNPQYPLNIDKRSQTVIILRRDSPENNAGVYALKAEDSWRSSSRHKTVIRKGEVVGRSDFSAQKDVVLVLDGSEFEDLVIMPCTYFPDIKSSYRLMIYSSMEMHLRDTNADLSWQDNFIEIESEWDPMHSGGCRNFKTWMSNPIFHLDTDVSQEVAICLSQPLRKNLNPIGFYVLDKQGNTVAKAPFMMTPEVLCEFSITAQAGPYLVIAATFNPGLLGKFTIGLMRDKPATFTV